VESIMSACFVPKTNPLTEKAKQSMKVTFSKRTVNKK